MLLQLLGENALSFHFYFCKFHFVLRLLPRSYPYLFFSFSSPIFLNIIVHNSKHTNYIHDTSRVVPSRCTLSLKYNANRISCILLIHALLVETIPKKCTFSTSLNRGSVRVKKQTRNLAIVEYRCRRGYSLNGNAVRKCVKGQWDSLRRPYCVRGIYMLEFTLFHYDVMLTNGSITLYLSLHLFMLG